MPRVKTFTAEQIIGKLRDAEVGLAQGKTVPEVVRKLGERRRIFLMRELSSSLVSAPPRSRGSEGLLGIRTTTSVFV